MQSQIYRDILKKQAEIKKPVHHFKPGESGNPKGRPKGSGRGIKDLLRRFGDWECPEAFKLKLISVKDRAGDRIQLFPLSKIKKLSLNEAVYLKVYIEAIRGESWAVQFIAERREGKVKETLALETVETKDLSGYTDEELIKLKEIHETAIARRDKCGIVPPVSA